MEKNMEKSNEFSDERTETIAQEKVSAVFTLKRYIREKFGIIYYLTVEVDGNEHTIWESPLCTTIANSTHQKIIKNCLDVINRVKEFLMSKKIE